MFDILKFHLYTMSNKFNVKVEIAMFKNMSMMEQKTWGSLVITLAVCTYFLSRILGADGIVNLDPAALIWLYIKIVILLMVLEIGHALFLLWHNKIRKLVRMSVINSYQDERRATGSG